MTNASTVFPRPAQSLARTSPWNGVLVLSGYGLRVAVERGHLVVEDGIGSDRRRDVLSRINQELKRLVIIGHAGAISLDAIRWLHGGGGPDRESTRLKSSHL